MAEYNLDARFISILYKIGLEIKKPYFFEQQALYWSITRLFSFYYRIVTVYNPKTKYHGNKEFLDADLESYFIRYRIILNDIAYILYQLLKLFHINPKVKFNKRTDPRNWEVSLFDFAKSLEKDTNPVLNKLRECVAAGMKKFEFMRNQRDNIAHYKSSIMIFGDGPDFEFATINPAGTMPTVIENGMTKLVLKNVYKFTNNQHFFLWNWMNQDLTDVIIELCATQKLVVDPTQFSVKLNGGLTIGIFKEINDI